MMKHLGLGMEYNFSGNVFCLIANPFQLFNNGMQVKPVLRFTGINLNPIANCFLGFLREFVQIIVQLKYQMY